MGWGNGFGDGTGAVGIWAGLERYSSRSRGSMRFSGVNPDLSE